MKIKEYLSGHPCIFLAQAPQFVQPCPDKIDAKYTAENLQESCDISCDAIFFLDNRME